jgi:predicted anti-sigma-YlaC factor YlaD
MCEQREELLDYLYEEATPETRREMESHLAECSECRDEVRAFRNVREDLLAWAVPSQPSVWTPFAPAPVVPWHKQVPAWVLATAASLMIMAGGAGGFLAQSVAASGGASQDSPVSAATLTTQVIPATLIDPNAILTVVRQELANSGRGTGVMTAANSHAAPAYRIDPATESRLLARVSDLVNASHAQQLSLVGNYLETVANEAERQRKADGQRLGELGAQVEQLRAMVSQMYLAQTKGQQ